jgi:hypothetical protein
VAVFGRELDGSVDVKGIACGRTVHLVGRDPNVGPELRHIKTLTPQQPPDQSVPHRGSRGSAASDAGSDAAMCAHCVCFSPDARTLFVAEAALGHELPSSLSCADLAPLTGARSKSSPGTLQKSGDPAENDFVFEALEPSSMAAEDARPPPSGLLQGLMTVAPLPRIVAYDAVTLHPTGCSFPWRLADNEGGAAPGDVSEPSSPVLRDLWSKPRRESGPTCIAAAATGAALACGTDNGVLRVWGLTGVRSGQQRLQYRHCLVGGAALDVAFSADGRFIVAVTEHSAHVAVLNAVDGSTVTEIALDRGLSTVTACCASFLPIGHIMTTNFEALQTELTPKFARSASMDDVFPLAHDEAPPALDVAVGCSDGYVRLFNVARRRLILGAPASAATVAAAASRSACRGPPSQHAQPANTNPARVLAVSCDARGRRISTASADGVISVFSATTAPGTPSTSAYTQRPRGKLPRALRLSGDGFRLLVGTDSGSVELFDAAAVPHVRPLGYDQRPHTGRVLASAYSPDGRLVATTGVDGNLCVLGVADVRRAAPVTLPQAPHELTFSDNALFATVDGVEAPAGTQSQRPGVCNVDVFGNLDEKEFEATPGTASGGCAVCCAVM